jgi:hypothetical protein
LQLQKNSEIHTSTDIKKTRAGDDRVNKIQVIREREKHERHISPCTIFFKKLKVNRSMGIFQNIETSKPKK